MSLSFNSSVSGIQATLDKQSVSANNIANINTEGYKKQHVNLSQDQQSQVAVNITENPKTSSFYKNIEGIEKSKVNFCEEIVVQIKAKNLLSANIAANNRTDEAEKIL
ncbi:MAG: flagellar basal body protein [Candidatus Scalindua sp.]|nr:flagellar basal body protein [Candidatus Scalindua sp.]